MKPHISPSCAYCGNELEKIEHLFYHCNVVKQFWREVSDFFWDAAVYIPIDIKKILFGISAEDPDSLANYIILTGKYYIWCNKFREPMAQLSMQVFKNILNKRIRELEGVAELLKNPDIIEKWSTIRLML